MKNFRDMAKKATTLSELMANRTKIQTAEVITNFPNGITINAVDIINTADATYPVVIFSEDYSRFYCGGTVLAKIVDSWLTEYSGDIETLNHDLAESGGVKVKLAESRTKAGKNVTEVTVL